MCQPLTFNQHLVLVRPGILAYAYITIFLSCLFLNADNEKVAVKLSTILRNSVL